MSISFFIEPDREGSRPFYQFVQHREITVAHTSTGELMYWIALDVDCKPDQHSFTQVSLLDDGKVYNRIGYTVWHFKRDHSNHTSVAVKEVEQPNEVWDPVLMVAKGDYIPQEEGRQVNIVQAGNAGRYVIKITTNSMTYSVPMVIRTIYCNNVQSPRSRFLQCFTLGDFLEYNWRLVASNKTLEELEAERDPPRRNYIQVGEGDYMRLTPESD